MSETLDMETTREIVVSYLHWSGSCRHLLTNDEIERVFCKGDGFGKIGREVLTINSGFDWSHVRDSSDEGWREMEWEICSIMKEKQS